MFRMRTAFYESGEKADKLLARQLKQKDARFLISAIKNEKDEVVTGNMDIDKVFENFYSKLYGSRVIPRLY